MREKKVFRRGKTKKVLKYWSQGPQTVLVLCRVLRRQRRHLHHRQQLQGVGEEPGHHGRRADPHREGSISVHHHL